MAKVGIVGAAGYTGTELIRLLSRHPKAELTVVTSDSEAGRRVADVFPALRPRCRLSFETHDTDKIKQCELVFFATPHATAMHKVPDLLDSNCRVIDLSADYRIKNAMQWQQWYGVEHSSASLLEEAVYGLTELNREAIKAARLVANPGCYPTAISLALLPAISNRLVELDDIIADAKSGVSGAGRKAALTGLYAEVAESFKAYAIAWHRHLPEIAQTLTEVANGQSVNLTFVPHLAPMNRGILATVYAEPARPDTDWQQVYENFYRDEFFIDVLPSGSHPETRSVRGTNFCQIAVHKQVPSSSRIIIVAAIDNLVKGAAGQAVQNMNLMLGYDETISLPTVGPLP